MSDTTAPPQPPSKGRVFFRRLFSTVLLWAIVLGGLFCGNKLVSDYVFLAIMLFLGFSGLFEFYGLVEKKGLPCFKYFGIIGGVVMMAATFFFLTGRFGSFLWPSSVNDFETIFIVLFVLGLCARQLFSHDNTTSIIAISTTLFGLLYVAWLLNFIQKINFYPTLGEDGKFYVFYFILVTKFSDMGAYCVGSLIGRHKMIPRISPAKTWEGFVGAILVSAGASLVFTHCLANKMPGMTPLHAVILGVVMSMTAVVGDLIESVFKREAGVKDSGTWFPGIGGILDLLDSLLFNAPIMYLYLSHVINPARTFA